MKSAKEWMERDDVCEAFRVDDVYDFDWNGLLRDVQRDALESACDIVRRGGEVGQRVREIQELLKP